MIHARDSQAIIAQCTPKGSGAIALLRISGENAFDVAASIAQLASGKSLLEVPSHTIHYGNVCAYDGSVIDHVMFFAMRGPKTFTGQDTIEITCHNNQFIIEHIITCAIKAGARRAGNGEFSKRAFLHGKIDLVQAEAIHELLHASNQQALKQSLAQLDGSFSQWLVAIEQRLIKCIAFSEASFEFIDEEDMEFGNQIKEHVQSIIDIIAVLKKTFDQQKQIRQGVRIALVGSVNAGKSSLFNALLAQERAIVTDIAGTTRDALEAGLYVNDNYWTLIDTAGLRKTDDVIEQEGIRRSHEQAQKADIVLLIYDRSRALSVEEELIYQDILAKYQTKAIVIANKADLAEWPNKVLNSDQTIHVSSNQKENVEAVHNAVADKITALFKSIESPYLLNQRHFQVLLELEKKLLAILAMFNGSIEYELLSCHLSDVVESLTELSGKTISEHGMDKVFREFCVGK